jgi:hypothetical protein
MLAMLAHLVRGLGAEEAGFHKLQVQGQRPLLVQRR